MSETQRQKLQELIRGGEVVAAEVSLGVITFTRLDREKCIIEPTGGTFIEKGPRLEAADLIAGVLSLSGEQAAHLKGLMDHPFISFSIEKVPPPVAYRVTVCHFLG